MAMNTNLEGADRQLEQEAKAVIGTIDHPNGPTAYKDAIKIEQHATQGLISGAGLSTIKQTVPPDPLVTAINNLKIAELGLALHLQMIGEKRAEVRDLKKLVARLYLDTMGRKPRRKAAAK